MSEKRVLSFHYIITNRTLGGKGGGGGLVFGTGDERLSNLENYGSVGKHNVESLALI